MADYTLGLYPIAGTGAMYNGVAVLVDGAGNTYVAFGNSNELNTNETWADVYKYAQGGAQLEHHTVHAPAPYKVDGVSLTHSGGNLVVGCNLHTPGTTDRRRAVASVQIPGYIYRQGMETEEGAAGAYQPSDGGGGGGEVDYDEVELRVRKVMGVQETVGGETVAHRISGINGDYRQGLEDKAKSAAIELLTGTDNNANIYKAALYDFLKNAAAGPLANVLGGQDAWGQARRDELKAAIREVLHEQA